MTIRENKFPITNVIVPQHVLLSVYDKTALDVLISGILEANPSALFYSTGGTGKKVAEILGPQKDQYVSIEAFTRCPEMEGGLVKTLHPKVHAGLLGERGNPDHERYILKEMEHLTGSPGTYFDIMVCNFYPFSDVVSKPGVTPEQARVNIDIGGPTMVRAAAKNWHSVAVITHPGNYERFVWELKTHKGISAKLRLDLARTAFIDVAQYDQDIVTYLTSLRFEEDVRSGLKFEGESE